MLKKYTSIILVIVGTISISLAQSVDSSKPISETVAVRLNGPPAKFASPLFVIHADGKKMEIMEDSGDSLVVHQFKPDWFESIQVFREKEGSEKYGERGQNGVILIELKKGILETLPEKLASQFKNG